MTVKTPEARKNVDLRSKLRRNYARKTVIQYICEHAAENV